jgi:hypothetical protein
MNVTRIALVAAIVSFGTQAIMAAAWDKKTKVTFNREVEVPGAVLPAGTYVFKLVESSANRHTVTVQNVRGNKTYATILAIPDYRLSASSRTVMYFGESGGSSSGPIPIKSWFYPGDNFGQRFVYPKKAATQIASTYKQPVPTTETVTPPAEAPKAEVKVTTPEKSEVAYQPQTFEKFDTQDTAGVEGEPVKEPTTVAQAKPPEEHPAETAPAKKLPATSSPLPLMACLGLLLLGGSGVMRYLGSRQG